MLHALKALVLTLYFSTFFCFSPLNRIPCTCSGIKDLCILIHISSIYSGIPLLYFPTLINLLNMCFFFKVITNCLWYLTNQHVVITGAHSHDRSVQPIPDIWSTFAGPYTTTYSQCKSFDKCLSLI